MNNNRSTEKHSLFQQLKSVVQRILSQHSWNVWSVHGGMEHLIQALDSIFQHGLKPHAGLIGVVLDYWLFVRGLRWLDPTLATDIDNLSKLSAASPANSRQHGNLASNNHCHLTHGQQWIEKSLKDRNISKQLSTLISDSNHVNEHYHDWSFMCDDIYTSAALLCLSALEQNSSALLAQIPSSLFTRRTQSHNNVRLHQHVAADATAMENQSRTETESKSLKTKDRDLPAVSDPLNASIEPEVVNLTRQQHRTGSRRSFSSFPSDCDMQSLDEPPAKNLYSTQASLEDRFTPNCAKRKVFSESDASKSARKPLFYDSSEDELDDLDFLSPVTELPEQDMHLDLYFSTIESKLAFNEVATNLSSKAITQTTAIPDQVPLTLPDLVISAEVSRSNNLTTFEKSLTEKPTEVKPGKDNKTAYCSSQKVQVKKHRRSRSDNLHNLKRLADSAEETDDVFTDNSHELGGNVKTSPLPPSSSLCDQPVSPGSFLTRSTSLMHYLKNQDLTTCADIEKENAHFDFSEILIGAIEQMKCQMQDSDVHTQQQVENDEQPHFSISEGYQSPPGGFISPNTYSIGTLSSRSGVPSGIPRSDTLTSTFEQSRSSTMLSDVSSYPEGNSRTAESIAIGLLQSVSGRSHLTCNDFDWLISEEDVPQKLLPLPQSTIIDPDFSAVEQGVRIRGNQEWAPPRAQIIFRPPIKQKLKIAMAKQNSRCAGCGTYVEREFMGRFRYCEYTGKYFCTCCHGNKLSVLPGKILKKFDFTKYKVSNFGYDLLQKISNDPLFNLQDLSPSLFKKAKVLSQIRSLREQMISLHHYLMVCRYADVPTKEGQGTALHRYPGSQHKRNQDPLGKGGPPFQTSHDSKPIASPTRSNGVKSAIASQLPLHILEGDSNIFSLSDLERVKSGELLEQLKNSVEVASDHVTSCELCRMKGFLCEICHSDEIIFPHQSLATICVNCKSCFHKKCFNETNCPKCVRLKKRKQMLEEINED